MGLLLIFPGQVPGLVAEDDLSGTEGESVRSDRLVFICGGVRVPEA